MLAWGIDCSSWDDTVDEANLAKWNFNEIPDENFIMTTWHENDSIQEVFWFAKNCAPPYKGELEINQSLIPHISLEPQKEKLLNLFLEA